MKRTVLLILALATLGLASGPVLARTHVGVMFNVPLWPAYYPYGSYYPRPYYDYYAPPPVVVIPASPPVYVEQAQPVQAPPVAVPEAVPQPYYWYHCKKPNGYYPYVKQCPGGWTKVSPQPPGE